VLISSAILRNQFHLLFYLFFYIFFLFIWGRGTHSVTGSSMDR